MPDISNTSESNNVLRPIADAIRDSVFYSGGNPLYGTGYRGTGIRAAATALYALSLAVCDGSPIAVCEKSKELYTNYAIALRDYLYRSYRDNGGRTTDGETWGDSTGDALPLLCCLLSDRVLPCLAEKSAWKPMLSGDTPYSAALFALCDPSSADLRFTEAAEISDEYHTEDGVTAVTRAADILAPFSLFPDRLLPDSDAFRAFMATYTPSFSRNTTDTGAFLPTLSPAFPRFTREAFRRFGILPDIPEESGVTSGDFAAAVAENVLFMILRRFPAQNRYIPTYPDASDSETANVTVRGKQRDVCLCPGVGVFAVAPKNDGTMLPRESSLFTAIFAGGITRFADEDMKVFPYKGGFLAYGNVAAYDTDIPGDENVTRRFGTVRTAFAVLPDDETVLLLSAAETAIPAVLRFAAGLSWRLPHGDYTYYYGDGKHASSRFRDGFPTDVGRYLNFDDRIGIVSQTPMTLYRESDCDRLCTDVKARAFYPAGTPICRSAAAIAVGGIRRTRALSESFLTLDALPTGVCSVSAVAANRKRYTLIYNLSGKEFLWDMREIPDGEAVLLAWDR